MRTHRPDDMDVTGPIPLPGAYLRDAGRRRIAGATSWSAIGGTALAVAFGALFAQSTANAEAQKAPVEPAPVANTEPATDTAEPAGETTAPAGETTAPAAAPRTAHVGTTHTVAPKPAAPRSAAPKPAVAKVVVNPTDEVAPPAPPAAAPKATTSAAPTHASSGAS